MVKEGLDTPSFARRSVYIHRSVSVNEGNVQPARQLDHLFHNISKVPWKGEGLSRPLNQLQKYYSSKCKMHARQSEVHTHACL